MADELSELDALIESDVLEALGEKVPEDSSLEIDGITIEDTEPEVDLSVEDELSEINDEESVTPEEPLENDTIVEEEIPDTSNSELDEILIENLEEPSEEIKTAPIEEKTETTVSSNDLASLLSQLLNNKTIEITIKIKD